MAAVFFNNLAVFLKPLVAAAPRALRADFELAAVFADRADCTDRTDCTDCTDASSSSSDIELLLLDRSDDEK
jgi:hypothetical protein